MGLRVDGMEVVVEALMAGCRVVAVPAGKIIPQRPGNSFFIRTIKKFLP
jgi:hypothetical protein